MAYLVFVYYFSPESILKHVHECVLVFSMGKKGISAQLLQLMTQGRGVRDWSTMRNLVGDDFHWPQVFGFVGNTYHCISLFPVLSLTPRYSF